jgi:uncharacterized protein YbbK (DUF523 family)
VSERFDSDSAILVSACLVGKRCRYDGGSCEQEALDRFFCWRRTIAVCPEELGGLGTPRPKAFFSKGDGMSVVEGHGRIVNAMGEDVSLRLLDGAHRTVVLAREAGVRVAYLKEGSPSCGIHRVWSRRRRVPGMGVTAAMLAEEGVRLVSV